MKQAGGMLEAQSARQLKEAKATGLTGGALKTRTLEQFGAEMDLIKAGTDKVPGKTPDAFSFRGNTDASKLTSGMGIQEGLPYFQSAILPLLVPALNLDNKDAELDRIKLQQLLAPKPTGTSGSTPTTSPDKSVTEETLKRKLTENAGKVQTVYTSVMSLFTKDGAAKVPPLLAQFCAQLHTLAKSKGMAEDQAYLLISSQLFLRIIVPMITMMVSAIGENQKGKRAMTVIAKLVQNDANNARHGDKDPLLLPFASLNHQAQMQAFVQEVISKGGTL
jgi:hypothetical protein